jgi:hypothetical protein
MGLFLEPQRHKGAQRRNGLLKNKLSLSPLDVLYSTFTILKFSRKGVLRKISTKSEIITPNLRKITLNLEIISPSLRKITANSEKITPSLGKIGANSKIITLNLRKISPNSEK